MSSIDERLQPRWICFQERRTAGVRGLECVSAEEALDWHMQTRAPYRSWQEVSGGLEPEPLQTTAAWDVEAGR